MNSDYQPSDTDLPGSNSVRLEADGRRARLAREVTVRLNEGWRVETHDDYQAVLVRGRLIERRELLRVQPDGSVTREELPLDRERLIVAVGLFVLVCALLIYVVATSVTGSDPGGGSPLI